MYKTILIILIIIILIIGIVIGYFLVPMFTNQTVTGMGEGVFGNASGISPPTLP